MMKKILTSAVCMSVLLASQLCMTAHAAQEHTPDVDTDALLRSQYEKTAGMYAYDGVASRLYSIGVLLGDGVNFNLDQIPDRQQACVMVVRMRGEEAAALAAYESGEITCPFTDVTDEWVKPYLAWLYEKQITLGIGGGKFGNAVCTAQEYITFMLRALGYTVTWDAAENTDVLYADVLEFADGIHLWDSCLSCEPVFHRGVMSAVTYQTLAAELRGSEERLLAVLAESGAVDAERAQPILDLFDRVDAAAAAELAAVPTDGHETRMTGTLEQNEYVFLTADMTAEDERTTVAYSGLNFDFGMDFTGESAALALNGETSAVISSVEMTYPMGMWLSDGTVYLDIMGQKQKITLAEIGALDAITSMAGNLSPLFADAEYRYYAVSDVSMEAMDGGTVIVYDTTEFMWPIIASMLDAERSTEDTALSVIVNTEKYIGDNGILSGVYHGMYAGTAGGDAQSNMTTRTEVLIESLVTYSAWGENAQLTFPDFSQFQEIYADPSEQ